MGRAEEFLDRYRALEEALCKKYNMDEKSGSPVMRFINDKESREYRDKLDLCREIRNFLSHHSEFGGERIVEPSQVMIDFLDEVTDYIRKPPLAITRATLFNDILKTSPTQRVQSVMKKMQRLGFSHVPVIENGGFVGVFSISTVFTYALKNGMTSLNDDMTISDFAELLPPDRHETESFRFIGKESTLFDVRNEFDKKSRQSRRLAVIFITENGTPGGRILGMLTPWDVISE